jgi:hypothetical protein
MKNVVRVGLLLLLITACGESFPPASVVSDFRSVAARVEAADDPRRANPSPGDATEVSILAIDRGTDITPTLTPGPLQWFFIPCIPLPTTIGPPICVAPIQPCEGCVATPPDDVLAEPESIRFTTPSAEELDQNGVDEVLLQGVLCSNGQPSPDALERFLLGESDDLNPCEGPATIEDRPIEGRFVSVEIPIESDPSDPNFNPEILTILLNGMQWPPPYDQGVPRTAPATGCAADLEGLTPEQRDQHPGAGSDPSVVELIVTEDSLQTSTVMGMEVTEEIQVSWLGDSGDFERTFSFITDPARSVLTQWRPFADAPEDGELVRFNFVIRDGRGGADWLQRGLCVLPP